MSEKDIRGFGRFVELSTDRSYKFIKWANDKGYKMIPTQDHSELVRLLSTISGKTIILYKGNKKTLNVHTKDNLSEKVLLDYLNHDEPKKVDKTKVCGVDPKVVNHSGFNEYSMQILKYCYGVDD